MFIGHAAARNDEARVGAAGAEATAVPSAASAVSAVSSSAASSSASETIPFGVSPTTRRRSPMATRWSEALAARVLDSRTSIFPPRLPTPVPFRLRTRRVMKRRARTIVPLAMRSIQLMPPALSEEPHTLPTPAMGLIVAAALGVPPTAADSGWSVPIRATAARAAMQTTVTMRPAAMFRGAATR